MLRIGILRLTRVVTIGEEDGSTDIRMPPYPAHHRDEIIRDLFRVVLADTRLDIISEAIGDTQDLRSACLIGRTVPEEAHRGGFLAVDLCGTSEGLSSVGFKFCHKNSMKE